MGENQGMATKAPAWMSKHPCEGCGTGYGFCAQYALSSLQCCESCAHPTRWKPDAYTADDFRVMWAGREADMPEAVRRVIAADRDTPTDDASDT